VAIRSDEDRANDAFSRISGMPISYFKKAREIYPTGDESAVRIFLALRTAARRVDAVVGTWLDEHGLSVTKFDSLHLIEAAEPEGASIGTLRDFLSMTQPNVTLVVQALERDGLATRHQDPSDRRATIVHITPAGSALLSKLTPSYLKAMTHAMEGINERCRLAMIETLADIAQGFEAVEHP
jgi:DNA-binding MarR family transcriptional regulator